MNKLVVLLLLLLLSGTSAFTRPSLRTQRLWRPRCLSDDPPEPPRKFTGLRPPEPFSERNQSLFQEEVTPNNNNPYEREINLASIFERTLPLQVGVLLLSFLVVIYVGLSGGIDESQRYFYHDDDEVDESLTPDYWSQLRENGNAPETQAPTSSVFL